MGTTHIKAFKRKSFQAESSHIKALKALFLNKIIIFLLIYKLRGEWEFGVIWVGTTHIKAFKQKSFQAESSHIKALKALFLNKIIIFLLIYKLRGDVGIRVVWVGTTHIKAFKQKSFQAESSHIKALKALFLNKIIIFLYIYEI